MRRLGYDRYGAQGGDWGAAVTTQIGRNRGHCVGIHLNMPIARPAAGSGGDLTEDEQQALAAYAEHRRWGTGYSKQQSTRPQTLGYGLVDSPVGQLAWIVEKFWAWTDCDGHPENVLSRDELLDNVMLYWVTGSGASSARLYWESFKASSPMAGSNCPPASPHFPRKSCAPREAGARPPTTSRTGRRCRAVGTSPRSSSRSCSSTTCARSSRRSAKSRVSVAAAGGLFAARPPSRAPATAPGIQRVGAPAGEEQQQEGEAVHHRGLAPVVGRKESVRQVHGEVGDRHFAGGHECGGPGEQAGGDQRAGDRFDPPGVIVRPLAHRRMSQALASRSTWTGHGTETAARTSLGKPSGRSASTN